MQLANGRYIQVHKPLTLGYVASHLEDYRNPELPITTIGAYALDENSQAKWMCFDADEEVQWNGLISLTVNLKSEGVPAYLEPSRRGGHLWLFIPPMPGVQARRFGNQLLSEHGLNVELYPKQDRLVEDEGAGSFVRLPLGIHRKKQWVYHFVDLDGNPLTPSITEQIKLLAAPELVPMDLIEDVLARSPEPHLLSPTPTFEKQPIPSGEVLSKRLIHRVSVFDFVSQYVSLDHRAIGHCPFHDDEHTSFQVNTQKNYWNCYADKGCGGGNIIHFWSKWREVHAQDPAFVPTITELAQMLF